MTATVTRRTALAAAATAPLALATSTTAAQGVDPAVAAFDAWVIADREDSDALQKVGDEAPSESVRVPAYRKNRMLIAHTEAEVDQIIEQQKINFIFDRANWIDPSPARAEGMAYAKANPYTAPDADALKAELRENIATAAEVNRKHRVEEKRAAYRAATDALIATPATTLSGIALKVRFASMYLDLEAQDEAALLGILRDAERLAGEA